MHTHPPAAVSVLLALLVLLLQLHTRSDHATLPTLPPMSPMRLATPPGMAAGQPIDAVDFTLVCLFTLCDRGQLTLSLT